MFYTCRITGETDTFRISLRIKIFSTNCHADTKDFPGKIGYIPFHSEQMMIIEKTPVALRPPGLRRKLRSFLEDHFIRVMVLVFIWFPAFIQVI